MKILVAVDGSPYTQKALAYLSANRTMFAQGSDLVLVHVSTGLPHNVTRTSRRTWSTPTTPKKPPRFSTQ